MATKKDEVKTSSAGKTKKPAMKAKKTAAKAKSSAGRKPGTAAKTKTSASKEAREELPVKGKSKKTSKAISPAPIEEVAIVDTTSTEANIHPKAKRTAAKTTPKSTKPAAAAKPTAEKETKKTTRKKTTGKKTSKKTTVKKAKASEKSEKAKVAPVQLSTEIPGLPGKISKDELCQLLNLSSRRIEQLVSDGIIDRERTSEGVRFATVDTLKKYIAHLADKANGRKKSETETELKVQKLKAEVALKESQGELHRLRTEIQAGRYIPYEEVKVENSRQMIVFKNFALGIPNRIAGRLSGALKPIEVREIEKDLQETVKKTLRSFVSSAVLDEEDENIPTPKGRTKLNEKDEPKDNLRKVQS